MNGYAGSIVRVDLTAGKTSTISTSDYEQWIGGHGMGSAIFFDLVRDKTIDGFDPGNVVTIMTSPLSGTLVPAASGRTEVQGIGVQSYPIGWFTRSNFGGRFAAMLKYAGWDGIVIEGKADRPVWVDIRNGRVSIRDCKDLSLWGTDTRTCQERIWGYVAGKREISDWWDADGRGARTTQRPAVLTIGPAGENLSRIACLVHDAGHGSGQGGFGAVWGSKKLKAISVIGTGGITVHDPKALVQTRLWQIRTYGSDFQDRKVGQFGTVFYSPPQPVTLWGDPPGRARPYEGVRPSGCVGCHAGCRGRYESGIANEAVCMTTLFYGGARTLDIQRKASELLNRYGLNAFEMSRGVDYLRDLSKQGLIGPGKRIDFPLDFAGFGSLEFVEQLVKMISYRNDGLGHEHKGGDDLAEGFVRAAKKWGRLEEDLKTGVLDFPHWGLPNHYEPRTELEWGYGSILGDRDINEHDFNVFFWEGLISSFLGRKPDRTVEETVRIIADKLVPYQGDTRMLDFSNENMYSVPMAKLVAWHRYYTRFWKQSALFCDWRWPDFVNPSGPGQVGSTGESEPRFLNAVTGKGLTFLDGIMLGRKIWNLDHAIWTLQGRHRDMVHFAEYIYCVPFSGAAFVPGKKDGKWDYVDASRRRIDKGEFERFKTRFYELESWDPATGYPTRSGLASLKLGYVADELEKRGKLGKDAVAKNPERSLHE
jgi:aldehyde:ferredoxin oxidoreductase